ncbi:MAG: ATP-dependent ligase [Glaciihabitans sp.]|nr:ATP-dependent ligase [Glaciihabitans sp.]
MGTLSYSAAVTVDFDDRVLAHLQVVIGAKLRRNESFYFSWKDDGRDDGGRTTIWLHPTMPLVYRYSQAQMPLLNREWLEVLSVSANTASGLQLVAEPTASANPDR